DTGQGSFYLYELSNPLPHAFVVHQARQVKNSDEILKELGREDFDPQKEVLLELDQFDKLDQLESGKSDQLDQSTTITTYLPERVVIAAKTNQPGFLVLTDSYDSGWEAKIDGQPAKINQADYLFRAVPIPAGEHQVEFEYKPKDFYLGAKISLTTASLMILFALFWLVKGRILKS
ncbi:MAG: YfhO family protein, partial [bacterium]|nr:YfhO family protein [bacterium]